MVNAVAMVRDEVWALCITIEGGFRANDFVFATSVGDAIAVEALSL